MSSPSLLFIAGDPSGDEHAAPIVGALHDELPQASLWGIGGPAMERRGFSPLMPFAPFNRMGFVEVAAHLVFFLKARKRLIDLMEKQRPDVLVCVDYPGFNMPMMKAAHRLGVPVVWYIAPMVWAWKRRRAEILGEFASHIAVIFPFEVDCFSPYPAPVTFVGNPTVEAMDREGAFVNERKVHPGADSFRLAIVPGSRRQEIEHLLPRMVAAFLLLRQRFPGLRATVSRYGSLAPELYRRIIGSAPVEFFDGPLRELLARAHGAMVTSGTATLEAALLGVPHLIAYHTSPVTYAIAKRLVRIPRIGLPNIVAGAGIVPECIQGQATGEDLARTFERFIVSAELYNETVGRLIALRQRLGEKKPSDEVSGIIKKIVLEKSNSIC
jgi:lipid-A-disaccharide synthase